MVTHVFLMNSDDRSSTDVRAPLLHDENVEQILEDGLTNVRDFQGLLATRPKRVIKWLQEDGMEKLGEFEVQVCRLPKRDCSKLHSHTHYWERGRMHKRCRPKSL